MARPNPPRFNYLNNLHEASPEQSPPKPHTHSYLHPYLLRENDYLPNPAHPRPRPTDTPIAQLQQQDHFLAPYTERESQQPRRKQAETVKREKRGGSVERSETGSERPAKAGADKDRDAFRIIKESHLMSDREILGSDLKKPTLIEELSESHFSRNTDRNASQSKSPLKVVIETQRSKSRTPVKTEPQQRSQQELQKEPINRPYLQPNSHEGYLPDDYRKTIHKVKAYEELGMRNVAFLQVNPERIPERPSKDHSKRTNNPYRYTRPPPEHSAQSEHTVPPRATHYGDYRDYLNPPQTMPRGVAD